MSDAQHSHSLSLEEREQLRAQARAERDANAKTRQRIDQVQKSAKRKKRLVRRELRKRTRG